jgi:hypothetical protein
MSDRKSQQPIDLSQAKQPSSFIEREAEKLNQSDEGRSPVDLTDETEAEKIAHQQNITAHIPGGSMITEIDK